MAGAGTTTTSTVMLPPDADFDEHGEIVTISGTNAGEGQGVGEDILQALNEQSTGFTPTDSIAHHSTDTGDSVVPGAPDDTAVTSVVPSSTDQLVTAHAIVPTHFVDPVDHGVVQPSSDETVADLEAPTGLAAISPDSKLASQPQQIIFTDQSGQPLDPETQQILLDSSIHEQTLDDGQNQVVFTQNPDGSLQQVVLCQPPNEQQDKDKNSDMKMESELQAVEDQGVYIQTPQGHLQKILVAKPPEIDMETVAAKADSDGAVPKTDDVGSENVVIKSLPQPSPPPTPPPEEAAPPQPAARGADTSSANSVPALGSSQNPIRIVQQGNQYTSLQQLTPEQLAQIMQVVQQQQVAHKASSGDGTSVLFNPVTQTRIVYRVIYPSELHSQQNGQEGTAGKKTRIQVQMPTSLVSIQAQPARRPYRKRKGQDAEEKRDLPELSRKEKEERKKHRPRTRSGRVSKPPKHMVQDYKQIHLVDWDEDYDDSDGGYSDFKNSDEEGERKKDSAYAPYLMLGSSKAKNFKCETCDKAYIGRAGLARHYRLKPGHGTIEGEAMDPADVVGADESSNASTVDSMASAGVVRSPPVTSLSGPSFSGIATSATTMFTINSTAATSSSLKDSATTGMKPVIKIFPGSPKSIPKAAQKIQQQSAMKEGSSVRRKTKLKEMLRQCEDEDLMEVVLPRLAKVVTLWEFLLMKTEQGKPPRPSCAEIYREFATLQRQVKRLCQRYLTPTEEAVPAVGAHARNDAQPNRVQVTDEGLAKALGLKLGVYATEDVSLYEEPGLKYKLLTSSPMSQSMEATHKRKVELVSLGEMSAGPPPKRQCLGGIGTVTLTSAVQETSTPSASDVIEAETASRTESSPLTSVAKSSGTTTRTVGSTLVLASNALPADTSQVLTLAGGGAINHHPATSAAVVTATSTPVEAKITSHSLVNGGSSVTTKPISEQPVTTVLAKPQQQMIFLDENGDIINPELLQISQTGTGEAHFVNVSQDEDATKTASADGMMLRIQSGPTVQGHIFDGELVQDVPTANGDTAASNDTPPEGNTENVVKIAQQVGEPSQEQQFDRSGGDRPSEAPQVILQNGDMTEVVASEQVLSQAQIYQTDDGLILVQNADGTIQVHGQSDQPVPLETVQALLTMEGDGQAQVIAETVDTIVSST